MSTAKTFTKTGKASGTTELKPEVFGETISEDVVHAVVTGQLRNRRQGTVNTKERGQVAYSTKKPWRQKGTGRARAGSRSSPLWKGGGTTFGPHPRTWNRPIPSKLRRLALKSIVLDRAANDQLFVVADVPWKAPKTKVAAEWLHKLGVQGSTLVITAEPDQNGRLSLRNIPRVTHTFVGQLSAMDLASHTTIVFTKAALEKLETVLT